MMTSSGKLLYCSKFTVHIENLYYCEFARFVFLFACSIFFFTFFVALRVNERD